MKIQSPLLVLFLLGYGVLFSQHLDIDTLNIQIPEVVVTAQYAPQPIEKSVYKLSVINAKKIRTKGANNLRELLQHELNMDFEQRSVFGTSIEIQGVSKENVKILIDGVPLIGRLNGIIDLSQINLDNIERVEIIEGPTSVFYGTDAMAGTINLISKKRQQKTIEGNVSAYYESIGASKLNANLGYMKNNSKIQLSAGRYNFGGYTVSDLDIRNREWESREQYYGGVQFTQWLKQMKLNYSGDFFSGELIKLGESDTLNNAKDVHYHTRRINNSLNFSGNLSEKHFLNLTAAYSDYLRYNNTFLTNVETNESELLPKTIGPDSSRFNLAFFKGQFSNTQKDAMVNYTVGTELNFENTEGKRILDGKQNIQSYAVFASANFTVFKQLSLQPGLRYTYNDAYGDLLTPAFNLKWDIGKKSRLLASYARGFRAPSLKELYLDFSFPVGPFTFNVRGNEDLKAEQSHNFNLSYQTIFDLGGKQKLTLEPMMFYNDISNLIALSAIVDHQRSYINVNQYKTHGGRLDIKYQINDNCTIKAGYALTGRYNSFSISQTAQLDEFLYTNDFNSEVNYHFTKQDLSLSLYYKRAGERTGYAIEKGTGNLIETLIGSHDILDFTMGKSLVNKKLQLNVGIKNILNVKNLDAIRTQTGEAHAVSSFLWGRTYFGRLEWKF